LFKRKPKKTTLKKAKDGLALSNVFNRPYAICLTPKMLN